MRISNTGKEPVEKVEILLDSKLHPGTCVTPPPGGGGGGEWAGGVRGKVKAGGVAYGVGLGEGLG